MEPSTVRLERGAARIVHDIGELVEVQTARALCEVTVYALDAQSRQPIDGLVHIGGATARTNTAFSHPFLSELDEKTNTWSLEPVWVEAPGYERAEICYQIEVANPP